MDFIQLKTITNSFYEAGRFVQGSDVIMEVFGLFRKLGGTAERPAYHSWMMLKARTMLFHLKYREN